MSFLQPPAATQTSLKPRQPVKRSFLIGFFLLIRNFSVRKGRSRSKTRSVEVFPFACRLNIFIFIEDHLGLMDWIRTMNNTPNISGTNGKILSVTEEELSKHNKRNDCWTAISGNDD